MSISRADEFDGVNEAVGVNQTLDQGFGARQSGMAVTFSAFQRDADAVANAPAAMNDVDDFTFSTAHAEKFGEAKFDNFAFLFPFESHSTLGLGLSRYGVSGIESRPENSDPFASQPAGIFSVADCLMVGSFARRWGGLDLGVNLNLLYRHLDQDGLGMRADAQALYTIDNRFRVGALLKGLIPSSARWQSGYAEYEAPEVYLGAAARFPAPYFYGTLETDWQSEGLFHQSAKSAANLNAGTAYEDPGDLLAASNVGMEFLFDFGMALRFGLSELSPHSFTDVTTFGIGYDWRHILGLDYSFSPHPGLLSTHRISLQFTPSFPKFSGRRFRPHAEGQAPRQESQSQDGNIRTPAMQPRNASDPQSAPPVKADQSAKPTPGGVSPTPGIPEKPLSPAPGADQEILDNEDNEEEGQ